MQSSNQLSNNDNYSKWKCGLACVTDYLSAVERSNEFLPNSTRLYFSLTSRTPQPQGNRPRGVTECVYRASCSSGMQLLLKLIVYN